MRYKISNFFLLFVFCFFFFVLFFLLLAIIVIPVILFNAIACSIQLCFRCTIVAYSCFLAIIILEIFHLNQQQQQGQRIPSTPYIHISKFISLASFTFRQSFSIRFIISKGFQFKTSLQHNFPKRKEISLKASSPNNFYNPYIYLKITANKQYFY